jgi:FkbM family methyltransferase
VIDIGAQVGVVSAYLGKKYPFLEIYAFEPVKENYDRLVRNLEANGVQNVTPLNMAVTSDGRDVVMDGSLDMNSGSMTIYGKGKATIKSMTLDDIMRMFHIDNIRLLKIDAEGSEYEILEASEHLLDKVVAIRGEIHPMPGKSQDELMTLIRSHISDVKMTVLQ